MNKIKDQSRRGASSIASALRKGIESGEYTYMEQLPPERVLEERFDVARGTIRLALIRLAEEGLVKTRRGSGTYVIRAPKQSLDNIVSDITALELMDARFALEPHICRLAVLHARRSELVDLEHLIEKMEAQTHDPQGFSAGDTEFHIRLVRLTMNPLLINIVDTLSKARGEDEWARMLQLTLNPEAIEVYNAHHRQILQAISNRQAEPAALAMKEHLEVARQSLLREASA